MNAWLVWMVFLIVFAVLGFVGYHFSVRTLRFVTGALAVTVAVLVTRYGITHPASTPANLVTAFTRGFAVLSGALFQPLLPGRPIPAPGRIGWLVIVAVLVFGYRELEVWAMRWEAPAVDMSALAGGQPRRRKDGPADDGMSDRQHDRLCAELRFRLPAVEVRVPSILPGGSKPNGLASIAENSGITGSGLAGAIIRFFGMLWPNPRRYQVRIWIEHDHGHDHDHGHERAPAGRRVTVDLGDPRTGSSAATKTLVAAQLDDAASAVAGYVARFIFGRDPTAPPWCAGALDGSDLAAMLVASQQRVLPRTPEEVRGARLAQIDIYRACHRIEAGVARYELALLHDLVGDHVEGLLLHALNREQYSRFYRGRYRLGMSLEMIANPEFRLRDEKDAAVLQQSLAVLNRCGVTDYAANRQHVTGHTLLPALRRELLAAAQQELCAVRRQLTFRRVLWAMFWHRDERAVRRPHLRFRERQSFQDGARVAELLVAARRRLSDEGPCPAPKASRQLRKGLRIAAAIAGDSAAIRALLNAPPPRAPQPPAKPWQPDVYADRARWLPWERRTPSWQAAYNTACLYAALAQSGRFSSAEMARRAVTSLGRAVDDRDCEMERPWDWISNDPDFSGLKLSSDEFVSFLGDQRQRDYPGAQRVIGALV